MADRVRLREVSACGRLQMQSFSREFFGVAFSGRRPLTGSKVSVSGGSTVDNIPYVSSIGLCIENAREY